MSSDLYVDCLSDSLGDFYVAPPLNYSHWNDCDITWRDVPEIRSEIEQRILDVYRSGNQLLAHQLAAAYFEQVTNPRYGILQVKSSKQPNIFTSGLPADQYFREFYDRTIHEHKLFLYQAGVVKDRPPALEPISSTHYPTLWAWQTYCVENGFSLQQPHSDGLKEFWHKHKKAIIIAAIIIVVAVAVTVVIVTTAGGGTSVAIAAGAGAAQAALDDYNSPRDDDPSPRALRFEPEVDERMQDFAKTIGAAHVNHPNGPIPLIEISSISPEITPEVVNNLVTRWDASLTAIKNPKLPAYNGPLFLEDSVMFEGHRYAYWEFLQKSKQEDVFASLLNTPKLLPVAPPPADPVPYQPIPPQPGSSFTRSFFEMIGREVLGPEVTAGTSPSELQKSHRFTTKGERHPSCRIGGINGMNTSLDYAVGHAEYLGTLAPGKSIDWIYNNSHGALGDVAEIFTQNYLGVSLNTADLLKETWVAFHDENRHNPKAKYLQICHSQGAIHVRNALMNAPKEIRDRVIVVAIAPAAVISKKLCFNAYNYASKKDLVPFGELLFAGALDTSEVGISRPAEMALEHRKELILLDPHPDATGIDHDFRSPTFEKTLTDHLEDYYLMRGEYE